MTKFEAGKKYLVPDCGNPMLCKFADSECVLFVNCVSGNPYVIITDSYQAAQAKEIREPREWLLTGHNCGMNVEGDDLAEGETVKVREVLE